jgi:hypothetical protein
MSVGAANVGDLQVDAVKSPVVSKLVLASTTGTQPQMVILSQSSLLLFMMH